MMNKNAGILLVAGMIGLASIAGVLVLAAAPEKPQPASLAEARLGSNARSAVKGPALAPPVQSDAEAQAPQAANEQVPDQGFIIKRILPINGPIKYGDWHWDDANVPPGPIVITVDLDARVLSVFRDGYEIGATAVLLGTADKPTPLGVYPITQKDKDHV